MLLEQAISTQFFVYKKPPICFFLLPSRLSLSALEFHQIHRHTRCNGSRTKRLTPHHRRSGFSPGPEAKRYEVVLNDSTSILKMQVNHSRLITYETIDLLKELFLQFADLALQIDYTKWSNIIHFVFACVQGFLFVCLAPLFR